MARKDRGVMPLLEHVREFRKRIVRSALFIFLFAIAGWIYYGKIITTLSRPVCDLDAARVSGVKQCGVLIVSGVFGPFNLQLKVAFITGVVLAAPFWIYQLWAFISPALHKKEKRNSILFVVAATPFFAMGAGLAYAVLPLAIKVLLGFTPNTLTPLVPFSDYLDFVLRLILAFGIAFELPVFLVALNLVGVLSGKAILKPWRLAIFGITLFTAVFTPTADPFSMIALAIPLVCFYFAAGGIALAVDKRRAKKKVSEDAVIASSIDQASPIEPAQPLDDSSSPS